MAEEGSSGDWCTIESDPGVFTDLLETLGCKGVELAELWSLDDDSLTRLKESGQVYGLIFLFKWIGEQQQEYAANKEPLEEAAIPPNLFFAHQVTTNACATQAILSVVFNANLSRDQMGNSLAEFQSFTSTFPPALKGVAISSSDEIRNAHNAFSRQDAFLQEGKLHIPTGDEEAFHFVAYVPVNNTVYCLDGLQKGPIVTGSYQDGEDWLSLTRSAIQERMTAGGNHVKFNLMAVVQDKRIKLKEEFEKLEESDPQYGQLLSKLNAEDHKREQWKLENQRRRHNYVPLCMQLLKELAKSGSLPQLVSEAKERYAEKRQKALEKKSSSS